MKRVLILIFIYGLHGQHITHEYEEVIFPNYPLNIEAEIIVSGKTIIRTTLFYRAPRQENYFQLNLLTIQEDLYTALIPISALDGDFVEYFIIAELSDGGIVSYPSLNPFENPIRVKIEHIHEEVDTIAEDQSGSLKSNAMILSPIPNSRVNLDDILIALSLFSVQNLDKTEVTVLFDDIDVSKSAIVEDDLLTYIPDEILPGSHNVSIRLKNSFGLYFEPVNWSFNVVSSYAESTESSFQRSGKFSSEMYESSVDGNIVQYNTYNVDAKGSWDWLKMKSKIKLSSLESEYQQSRNRYSVGFTTPFLILNLGDVNPVLNQYVLNGTRIRGVDLNLKTKYIQLKYIKGELARAVQGNPLEEAMVISSVTHPSGEIILNDDGDGVWDIPEQQVDENYPGAVYDTENDIWFLDANGNGSFDEGEDFIDCNSDLSICEGDEDWIESMGNGVWDAMVLNGDLGIGRDNYTFKNEMMAANLGIGSKDKLQLNFHFLKSRDNIRSVLSTIDGSIVHLTDELDTLVSETGLQYFEIDTSVQVTETEIVTEYDFSIPFEVLMENCNEIFGDNYNCQTLNEDWSGVLPQDNLIFGSDLTWVFDDKHMILESGFSFSLMNQNIWDPVMTSDELDTLAVIGDGDLDGKIGGAMNIPFDPVDFEDYFIMNLNQVPLLPIDVSEGTVGLKQILHMPSLAYNLNLKMNYGNHNVAVGYRQIGPDYYSSANPNIQKNIRERTITDRAKFFNNRMFAIFKYQNTDDGINLLTETISTTKKMDLNINLYPGVGLPTFSLGIGVNSRDNGVNEEFDTMIVGIDTTLVESSNRDYTKTTRSNILVSNQFKYNGIHNISLNISKSDKIDLMERERGSAIITGDYYSPASTSNSFSINLKSNFTANVESNISINNSNFTFSKGKYYQSQNLNFMDLMFILKNTKLFNSMKFGGNVTFGYGAAEFEQYTFKTGLENKFFDILLLKTNIEYRRKIVIAPEITKYNNYQATVNLVYIF